MNPAEPLIEWYHETGRPLPWRSENDPYKIWISEIILQQTRVAQGKDYYLRFVKRFPDVFSLAQADQEEVLKYWEGLGYYSRARNLHATAQIVADEMGGKFPDHWEGLLKLKGIGPYTARAIGSFAFGNQVGVIDGNVFRVLTRYLGDGSPIDKPATRKKFQALLDEWVAEVSAADFNQAIMDLGAMVCTPRSPGCMLCPIQTHCVAYRQGNPEAYPVKSKKLQRSVKYFDFFLVENEAGEILIRRRPQKGIWAGLWEIPNVETDAEKWNERAFQQQENLLGEMKHVLTHVDMMIRIYRSQNESQFPEAKFISRSKIPTFAFSRAVLNIFAAHLPNIA